MKSVFLIKTPLQLLNAIEARSYFELNTEDCILIVMGDRKSQPQILNLAAAIGDWGKVLVLNDVNFFYGDPLEKKLASAFFNKSIFNVWRLNKISKALGEVKYIFIGYARYIYMRHFINVMPHEEVIFLDDGNATIQLAKERCEGYIPELELSVKKKIKLVGKRYLQGIKDKEKDSVTFFTIYDVSPGINYRVVKNEFKYLRSNVASQRLSESVYFIGSPISATKIISLEDEIQHIRRVKDYFDGKSLVYVSHRRESAEKLNKLKNISGIEVVTFDYPLEYQLAYLGPCPKILTSFISSALDSCHLIFGDKMEIISFKLDLDQSPKRELVESIYDSYESIDSDDFKVECNY